MEDVPVAILRERLAQFGLEGKDPEQLGDGTQVLGLTVVIEIGEVRWKQGSIVLEDPDVITR